jgi:hypothetical protein
MLDSFSPQIWPHVPVRVATPLGSLRANGCPALPRSPGCKRQLAGLAAHCRVLEREGLIFWELFPPAAGVIWLPPFR